MAIDPARYVFVPGVSEVDDIDLDEVVVHDRTGQRVTEATLDMEFEEMTRRYPGLRPGGKSLSGDGSISPRFQVRLDRATAARVRQRASAEGKSPAKLLREIITADLAVPAV
ncbi:MAG: hypothetical protein LBI33_12190 [Propionibacteriaceae bacterium]|jgi:hypothetical protein|nr:hypothetical protein [Propionibacteriaceae bacterium]